MIDDAVLVSQMQAQLEDSYRLSLSILGSPADAQDAVQQAMLRAWERREQIRDEARLRAWLMRIVVNECRNIQRKRMRVFPAEQLPNPGVQDEPQRQIALRVALDALTERLRTPILLRYMNGLTEREIAAVLGIPVTTVKNRLYRARRALEDALKGADFS